MKTFLIMAGRSRCRMSCGHKRCMRREFISQWLEYMYGHNGKRRFGQGKLYDGVIALPGDLNTEMRLMIWNIERGYGVLES